MSTCCNCAQCVSNPHVIFHSAAIWKGTSDVADFGRSCIETGGDLYRFVLKIMNYADGGTYIKESNCHGTQKASWAMRARRVRLRYFLCRVPTDPPFVVQPGTAPNAGPQLGNGLKSRHSIQFGMWWWARRARRTTSIARGRY